MMTYRTYIYTLIYFFSCIIFHVNSQDQACDKSKCKGPIAYYEEIQCTPIYSNKDRCCPVRYNCDHVKERSKDKCYINGHVYELREPLRDEDAKPCDIGCVCAEGLTGVAQFNCAVVDCFFGPPKPGCYRKNSVVQCCPGEEVCPEKPEDRPRCVVDGRTYLDGEAFSPSSDPTRSCNCMEGYTGANVEPFCRREQPHDCGTELHQAIDIYNCTPAYYSSQNPATDCGIFLRCKNENDTVVESARNSTETGVSDPDFACNFGQLTMKIGDQLNQATDYSSVCLKCVCEVPPLPTCQRLPDNECDVTVHPPFHNFSK